MLIKTGTTINELLVSFDVNNNPVSAATFTTYFFIDGILTNSIIPTISLSDGASATFYISWSASTYGMHQCHIRNNTTSIIYVSDLYNVRPDSEVDVSPTIYVGL